MFVVKSKKQIMIFAVTAFLGISTGAAIRFSDASKVFLPERGTVTVLIDAGHGLPDGGAVGSEGTIEHEINLSIAKKTEEILSGKGFATVMTREGEEGLALGTEGSIRLMKKADMRKRKKMMKDSGAELFISIHMNSYTDRTAGGLHFFYDAKHPEISGLAEAVQAKISKITGAKAHAVKTADETLFLMKNPPIPAVLAECGFLSNPEEEKLLKNDEYQAKIAWAIADAIEEYYYGAKDGVNGEQKEK